MAADSVIVNNSGAINSNVTNIGISNKDGTDLNVANSVAAVSRNKKTDNNSDLLPGRDFSSNAQLSSTSFQHSTTFSSFSNTYAPPISSNTGFQLQPIVYSLSNNIAPPTYNASNELIVNNEHELINTLEYDRRTENGNFNESEEELKSKPVLLPPQAFMTKRKGTHKNTVEDYVSQNSVEDYASHNSVEISVSTSEAVNKVTVNKFKRSKNSISDEMLLMDELTQIRMQLEEFQQMKQHYR